MFNLSIGLEDSARRYPKKEGIISGNTRLSFEQLNALANQVANALVANGLETGNKVALSCPNLHFFPVIYYGILKAGGTVVPLSILLKHEEITYHLNDSEAKFYFCFEGTEALPLGKEGIEGFSKADNCQTFIGIRASANSSFATVLFNDFIEKHSSEFETVQTNAEDTAVIIYTSGTTGRPKGAELTHSNLAWNADLCRHLFQFNAQDITLTVLPMFHIFGQTCLMNSSIMHGVTNVLLPRFDASLVLETMQQEGVTIFAGVPTMYWGLLNFEDTDHKIDLEKIDIRLCISGGASLPVQVLKDFEAKYEVSIYEGYGMSEGSPVVTFNHPGQTRKPGSIGTPVWGVEVKLVNKEGNEIADGEKGELLYRGHNVMKGYYNQPEATAISKVNGWLHSGDVATRDEEGYYYIVDRTKDMILRGGLNVYPREVEEVIIQHEAVSLVAVVGVPDEKMGEEVKAFIVLKEGATAAEDEMIAWTKERIAAYKYPRQVEFIDALPMSATGKILKRELTNK